jgi:hypothetical protein
MDWAQFVGTEFHGISSFEGVKNETALVGHDWWRAVEGVGSVRFYW